MFLSNYCSWRLYNHAIYSRLLLIVFVYWFSRVVAVVLIERKMELSGDNGRVDTTMSVSRVPSPTEMACQVAENWCYTQVQCCCDQFTCR